uniref:Uncharacterized protein n=1 Tax=Sphaerodactylus townsendi TaxID=933632 RepID=A0ACB8F8X1_9SAUR
MEDPGLLCGLRAGWGRSRAAAGPGQALCKAGCKRSRAAGGGEQPEAGWDEAGGGGGGGRLWGQVASRGGCSCGAEEAEGGAGMAAPLSDPGSNSERSADSPLLPDDDDAASAGPARSASPEWGEERFRVDRKKLEAMLQAEWDIRHV